METDGGLRHLAFFEELGKMDESDSSWRAVSAGLVTMRLVDRWIAVGSTSRLDSWSVSAVREAIAQVAETTPIRRILTSVVDVMVACTATDMHALSPRLMAYGQALEYEAKWSLASDVYSTITSHTHPVDDSDIAVSASLQLGFCLKSVGQFDDALKAYGRASELAEAVNDVAGVLRGQIGDAKVAAERGNLPRSETILGLVIERARELGLDDVRSRALTDRAFVAGNRGDYPATIRFSYDALVLSKSPRTRDRILTNIATAFRYLGNFEVSKNAYLVLAATAQEQFVRWNSLINLIELAAREGNELQFDRYRRELETVDLSPQLHATYLLYVGRGYNLLDRSATALPYLERAIEVASQHGFNQLVFEAESELASASRPSTSLPTPEFEIDRDAGVDAVASAIASMKELALVG
jgi:tetratricopeptide (TPR) repeat protein